MTEHEQLPENPITLEEIELLIQEHQDLAASVLAFVARLRARSNVDQRWLAIGTTDFEKGMMSIGYAFTKEPMKEINAMLQSVKG